MSLVKFYQNNNIKTPLKLLEREETLYKLLMEECDRANRKNEETLEAYCNVNERLQSELDSYKKSTTKLVEDLQKTKQDNQIGKFAIGGFVASLTLAGLVLLGASLMRPSFASKIDTQISSKVNETNPLSTMCLIGGGLMVGVVAGRK